MDCIDELKYLAQMRDETTEKMREAKAKWTECFKLDHGVITETPNSEAFHKVYRALFKAQIEIREAWQTGVLW